MSVLIKMTEKKKYERKGRTTVDLHGEELKQAIALRHIQETAVGEPVKLSNVVREAIREKYRRDIESVEKDQTVLK
jgi:predicted thioesterase